MQYYESLAYFPVTGRNIFYFFFDVYKEIFFVSLSNKYAKVLQRFVQIT